MSTASRDQVWPPAHTAWLVVHSFYTIRRNVKNSQRGMTAKYAISYPTSSYCSNCTTDSILKELLIQPHPSWHSLPVCSLAVQLYALEIPRQFLHCERSCTLNWMAFALLGHGRTKMWSPQPKQPPAIRVCTNNYLGLLSHWKWLQLHRQRLRMMPN